MQQKNKQIQKGYVNGLRECVKNVGETACAAKKETRIMSQIDKLMKF